MAQRMPGSTPRRINIGYGRWIGAVSRPVVTGNGLEIAGLRLAAARIKHGATCLVGKEFGRPHWDMNEASMQRLQFKSGEVDQEASVERSI
jgi:hypothetical protein